MFGCFRETRKGASVNNSHVDYPMSSTYAAEKNPWGTRATMVLAVFSFIGLGAFASSIVLTILLAAFKGAIERDIQHLEWVWRLLMGIGERPLSKTWLDDQSLS